MLYEVITIQIEPQGALRINPVDAVRLTLTDGDRVKVSNRRGNLTTAVKLAERVPQGRITSYNVCYTKLLRSIASCLLPNGKAAGHRNNGSTTIRIDPIKKHVAARIRRVVDGL